MSRDINDYWIPPRLSLEKLREQRRNPAPKSVKVNGKVWEITPVRYPRKRRPYRNWRYKKYNLYNYVGSLVDYFDVPPWEEEKATKRFEKFIFPARRDLTPALKKLAAAGCPVYRMKWRPHGRTGSIYSFGPIEAIAAELEGYPVWMYSTVILTRPCSATPEERYELNHAEAKIFFSRMVVKSR